MGAHVCLQRRGRAAHGYGDRRLTPAEASLLRDGYCRAALRPEWSTPGLPAAGTGHRPGKLGGYGELEQARLLAFAKLVLGTVRPSSVTSGMALGWDVALAEAAVLLGIGFIAAVPFEGQEARWRQADRDRHRRLLSRASRVHVVCPGPYEPAKMRRRNEWMVDSTRQLLSLWDGSPGGTANCVSHALGGRTEVIDLWPLYLDRCRSSA